MLWILRTALLAVLWVVSVAVLSFWFTLSYSRLIPTAQHHVDLHFDYANGRQAQATAQFPAMLRVGQKYLVAVEFVVPDVMQSVPNFMVKARLAHGPRLIATLLRPGLLRRRSWLVEIAYKALRLPLYLANVIEETRVDTVSLTDSFKELSGMPVTSVTVDLWASNDNAAAKVPECFASRLVFSAQLTTFQHLLVTYRVVLFMIVVFGGASLFTFLIGLMLLVRQLNSDVGAVNQSVDVQGLTLKSNEITDNQSTTTSTNYNDSEDEYSADEQLVPLL